MNLSRKCSDELTQVDVSFQDRNSELRVPLTLLQTAFA